jgi:hypothetical protein
MKADILVGARDPKKIKSFRVLPSESRRFMIEKFGVGNPLFNTASEIIFR